MELWFIKNNARQWVSAISKQGYRLLEANNREFQTRTSQEEFDKASRRDLSMWRRIEEHFFVIAVGKAMDWLKELKSADTSCHSPIDDFFSKIPHAREIRNMREHDNEYSRGKGHKQSAFLHKITGYKANISAAATATVILNEGYLIGGRLNVQETITAAEKLQQAIFND
jgi:hypothetical protein